MKTCNTTEGNSDNNGLRQSRIDWFFPNNRGCIIFETCAKKCRKRTSTKKTFTNSIIIEERILPFALSSDEEDEQNSNSLTKTLIPSITPICTSQEQEKTVTTISLNKPTKQTTSNISHLNTSDMAEPFPVSLRTSENLDESQSIPSTSNGIVDASQPVPSTSKAVNLSQSSIDSVIVPIAKSSRRITDSDIETDEMEVLHNTSSPAKKPKLKPEYVRKLDKTVKEEDSKMNLRILRAFNAFLPKILQTKYLLCLLEEHEKVLLQKYMEMEQKYQYLCLKLFTWEPIWYNIFKYSQRIGLKMTDQEAIRMFNFLKENEFVDTEYLREDTTKLLNLLDVKELKEVTQTFKIKVATRKKSELIEKLLRNCKTQSTLTQLKSTDELLKEKIKEKMGFCIKLTELMRNCLNKVYLLGTFANRDFLIPQDFFKSISFNIVYPKYIVDDYQVFYSREQFSGFIKATICQNDFNKSFDYKNYNGMLKFAEIAAIELKQIGRKSQLDQSRLPYLEQFLPAAIYVRILTVATKFLTTHFHLKVKEWLELLISFNYCNHKRSFWYNQLALVQSRYLKDHELAVKTLIKVLSDEKENLSEVQLYELGNRAKFLKKKTYNISTLYHDLLADLLPEPINLDFPSITIDQKTVRNNEQGRKRDYIEHCKDGSTAYLRVEEVAIQYYKKNGYRDGIHCESSLVCTIFSLLFWDIIYDFSVPGTFVSDLQSFPMDMYTKYFYENRKLLIEERLKQIRNEWSENTLNLTIINNFNLHSQEKCLYKLDVCFKEADMFLEVIACMKRGVLAKIMEKLAKNYRDFCSGFPDLFLWNFADKKCKFVEVKGERDKLSVKQKLWLNYLDGIGADIEVCHVHSTGSKKRKH